MLDSTERFSDRVDDYVKYRPGYPTVLHHRLVKEFGLQLDDEIVDVGYGTGLLSRVFLDEGHRVLGVEPNEAMRTAGEAALAKYDKFTSVAGTAEATTLPDGCADVAVAGQAFHWFDPDRTRTEMLRVLRGRALVILVWNTWHQSSGPFIDGYRDIVDRYSTDPVENHHASETQLRSVLRFFGGHFEASSLDHTQPLDREGLRGRLLSASYAPPKTDEKSAAMLKELDALFDAHQEEGQIRFDMRTQIFAGRLRD